MTKYYDGTKLLSLKDLDGNTPEVFLCTSNRTAGKTTYFNRLCLNKFIDKGEKFMIVFRFVYELDDCANKFFKVINTLFFPDGYMESKRKAHGYYHELYYKEKLCGYAVALNAVDNIKKTSQVFSDVKRMLMDEFQSESNHYCVNEVEKLMSLHTSVARGEGEQVRYVPVYLVGNPVSIINPYYVALGISSRLNAKVKFLKGHGFVLEQGYNESASNAQKTSGFNKAFASSDYLDYSAEGVYLNDNLSFIDRPESKNSKYVATIRYNGADFGIREYRDLGIVYCDSKADNSFPFKISVTTEDHNINYVMLKQYDVFVSNLRFYFERGCFRFKDLRSKEALMALISY